MKNKQKITLIALVVISVSLLILSYITIEIITKKSRLLNKTYTSINEMTESEAREKLELDISNLITDKSNNLQVATLNDLIEDLNGRDEYKTKRETDKTILVRLDEYAFRVDDNLNIIDIVNSVLVSHVETIYMINSTTGNDMNITVIANSDDVGIEKIITPDNREINVNEDNKRKVAIDYKVTSGEQYIFKIKVKGSEELKNYILEPDANDIPNIIQNTLADVYPMITDEGIILNKNIQIDYGEGVNNYYSTDNGSTWKLYNGVAQMHKTGNLLAKTIVDGEITKMDKKSIELKLASDALPEVLYDGKYDQIHNFSNDIPTSQNKILLVDESAYGQTLGIAVGNGFGGTIRYTALDENDEVLSTKDVSLDDGSATRQTLTKVFDIPQNTKKIKFYGTTRWQYIYEVGLFKGVTYAVEQLYPTIKITGIEAYNNVTINYFKHDLQKLYKIDNGEWQNYDNRPVQVPIDSTIYMKGIEVGGIESEITSYKSVLRSDALSNILYDGKYDRTYAFSTDDANSQNKILLVDESMYGQALGIAVGSGYGGTMRYTALGENDEVLSTKDVSLDDGSATRQTLTKVFDIPQNTKKIKFYGTTRWQWIYEMGVYKGTNYTVEQLYPIMRMSGIEAYNNVTIKYFSEDVQRLYRINDEDWQSYNDEPVKVPIGSTIYMKGIEEDGKESEVMSYTAVLRSDGLSTILYDGKYDRTYAFSTDDANSQNKILLVDESMYGHGLGIAVGNGYGGTMRYTALGENDEVLSTKDVTLNDNSAARQTLTKVFDIPENTKKIKFYGTTRWQWIYEMGPCE